MRRLWHRYVEHRLRFAWPLLEDHRFSELLVLRREVVAHACTRRRVSERKLEARNGAARVAAHHARVVREQQRV